jgi:hypothetical protein
MPLSEDAKRLGRVQDNRGVTLRERLIESTLHGIVKNGFPMDSREARAYANSVVEVVDETLNIMVEGA